MTDNHIFNNIVTPGFVEPIEDRPSIDLMKSAEAQLKEVMLSVYEPNKLSKQTEFNAISLYQLNNEEVGDQTLVRVKARVPEVHNLLPIPANAEDFDSISLYPTFQAASSDFGEAEGLPQGAIVPGSKIVVSFDQLGNFSEGGGSLKKVFSWKDIPADGSGGGAGGSTAMGINGDGGSAAGTGGGSGGGGNAPAGVDGRWKGGTGGGPLGSTSGDRSNSRNTEPLNKKYQFNNKLVSDQQITTAIIDSWYELVLLTHDRGGAPPRNITEAHRQSRKVGIKPKWTNTKSPAKTKWGYPRAAKGWGGKCLQFASVLIQLANDRLGEPYGRLPFSGGRPSAAKGAYYKPNTNLRTMDGSRACKMTRIKNSKGYFGAGNNLKDLAKLGMPPGALVHVSVAWDKTPNKCYEMRDAFHHWLVYVGIMNGTAYYCDGRGIKSAAHFDRWLKGWMRGSFGNKGANSSGWSYGKLRSYLTEQYGNDINSYNELKKIDKYSAAPLVRHVHSPFPLVPMNANPPKNVASAPTQTPEKES